MKFVTASREKKFVATKATTQVVIQEAHVLKNISRGNDLNVCSCMTWPQKRTMQKKKLSLLSTFVFLRWETPISQTILLHKKKFKNIQIVHLKWFTEIAGMSPKVFSFYQFLIFHWVEHSHCLFIPKQQLLIGSLFDMCNQSVSQES